jgi:hypothetical protein
MGGVIFAIFAFFCGKYLTDWRGVAERFVCAAASMFLVLGQAA